MSATSYYIVTDDVEAISREYLACAGRMETASDKLSGGLAKLSSLDSFQGAGAQAVKAYFNEVHGTLIDSLMSAVDQLKTDFCSQYQDGFFGDPVNASAGAKIPEDGLRKVEKSLQALVDGNLADAQTLAIHALNTLPAGVSFSAPNPAVVQRLVEGEKAHIKKIREGARAVEDAGVAKFGAEHGPYADFATSLSAALAACVSGSVMPASYTNGAFSSIMDSTGLRENYQRCRNDQIDNFDSVKKSQEKYIMREDTRIKEEQEKALKEKKRWATIGLIAAVVVCVAAAAVVVASAGAATPLLCAVKMSFAAVSFAGATKDVAGRVTQLDNIKNGDGLADRWEDSESDVEKYGKGGLKEIATEGATFSGLVERNKDVVKDFTDSPYKGVVNYGVGTMTDALFDGGAELAGDEKGKAYVSATGELTSGAVDVYMDGGFDVDNSVGFVGAAGKATEAIADYYADQADAKLEELADDAKELDGVRKQNEADAPHQPTSTMWS